MRVIKSKHKELEAFNKQLRHQTKYFNNQYSHNKEYVLSFWQKSYIKRIREDLLNKQFKNKKLLDVGAGGGYVSIEMAKLGLRVVSLDISSESINILQRQKRRLHLKNFSVLLSGAEDIPLPNKSVDYIVANAILEHIVQEKKTISEWLRILKEGGRIFLTVPLQNRYVLPIFWPINYVYDKSISHLRRYSLTNLQQKFGLKTIKVYYTGHFIKMIWLLFSTIFKNEHLDEIVEKYDYKLANKRYGASNIIVIFQK